MAEWDTSELTALAARFRVAPAAVIAAVTPAATRAAVNIKRDMKQAASGHGHLPGLSRTVEYTVTPSSTEVRVEVGFNKTGQGNLANIAAFGSVNNAPVMDITQPLRAEVPRFMKWASKAIAGAV